MAHKKGVGSSRNGRDSNPKFRGIKKYGGEFVVAGNIILRQCGTKWHPGTNVGMGTDYTIYSLVDGVVQFQHKSKKAYKVSVLPIDIDADFGVLRYGNHRDIGRMRNIEAKISLTPVQLQCWFPAAANNKLHLLGSCVEIVRQDAPQR